MILKDVQSTSDNHRHIEIHDVGISNIRYPIYITQKSNGVQHTIGLFQLSVLLKPEQKGTHMSRFIKILEIFRNNPINRHVLSLIAKEILNRLETTKCTVKCEFPYFISKKAPVSNETGLIDYDITFELIYDISSNYVFNMTVNAPATSLCPCSKEISDYGAHNQRSNIKVKIQQYDDTIIWIEDIVELIERNVSCPIYSILKRIDEKYVTEYAYNNPMFCEDIVRNIAYDLEQNYPGIKYKIEVNNIESIHNHNAYAMIDKICC